MNRLGNIGKLLEKLSEDYERIPLAGYAVAGGLLLMLLLLSALVIPRLKITRKRKVQAHRICAWCMIGIYGGTVLLGNSLYGLLFLPVGILFARQCTGKYILLKAVGAGALLSLCVQTLQMVVTDGTLDVRIFLANIPWTVLGAGVVLFWRFLEKKSQILRYLLRTLMVLIAVVLFAGVCAFGIYHVMRVNGKLGLKNNISQEENRMNPDEADLIWYNGKAYQYNKDLITILVMGIDQNSEEIEQVEGVSGESGQADSIFLLVLDEHKKRVKVIGMSRDIMTEIKTFDYKGNYVGDSENHLGLAYAFGDGKETSCQYMVDAVSKLFYGIPINSYVALNMEAVEQLNDSVGGVTVTVPDELAKFNPSFTAGSTVTLKGEQALSFIRSRDTETDFSNNLRMARQKTYLVGFVQAAIAKTKADLGLPARLYKELSKKMVTDIDLNDAVYLATKGLSVGFDDEDILVVPGEAKKGTVYDEMYVDEQALYELILDTFYNDVSAGEGAR